MAVHLRPEARLSQYFTVVKFGAPNKVANLGKRELDTGRLLQTHSHSEPWSHELGVRSMAVFTTWTHRERGQSCLRVGRQWLIVVTMCVCGMWDVIDILDGLNFSNFVSQ